MWRSRGKVLLRIVPKAACVKTGLEFTIFLFQRIGFGLELAQLKCYLWICPAKSPENGLSLLLLESPICPHAFSYSRKKAPPRI
jgi:hypothetical protein